MTNIVPAYWNLRDVDGLSHGAAIAKLVCQGYSEAEIKEVE